MTGQRRRVLLTVSGTIPDGVASAVTAGERARADYIEMADVFGADLIDHVGARIEGGRIAAVLGRLAGNDAALAWACFRRRGQYRIIFTDGEQVGLPLAVLLLCTRRRPRHVMIGHVLSPRKKVLLHRLLGLRRRIDVVVVYSSSQRQFAIDVLGYTSDQVVLTPFMVDTTFWSLERAEPHSRSRPMICAVGRELRDYPPLIEAVRGLDVDLVIADASPWSKRAGTSGGQSIPSNVQVGAFDHLALRQLYAESAFVVVPLVDVDFQAGITTILEGMSMGRAIVCTRTAGQTDTIVDGVNGIYVPPGDVDALRSAILELLGDPMTAERMGTAGQQWAREVADVDRYVERLDAVLARADSAD